MFGAEDQSDTDTVLDFKELTLGSSGKMSFFQQVTDVL